MYGMTEEQFWRANPAIIEVWEEAWKRQENRKNELIHAWVGEYGISALVFAIDHCLNGKKKARSKYMEKPIRLFELTESEKKAQKEKATDMFIAWANATKEAYDIKTDNYFY